jgi:hypothetical protein
MIKNVFSKMNFIGSVIFILHIVVMHLIFPILAVWGVGVWVPDGFQYLFPIVVSLGIFSMSKKYSFLSKINPLQVLILGAILFSLGLFGHSHGGAHGHEHHGGVEEGIDWFLILGGVLLTVAQVWHFKLNPPHKDEECSFPEKSNSIKLDITN